MRSYDHTQRSTVHWLVAGFGVALAGTSAYLHLLSTLPLGIFMVLFAVCFAHLRVWDEGDALRARFGPIPLIGMRIPYAGIESVQVVRVGRYMTAGKHCIAGVRLYVRLAGRRAVALNMKAGAASYPQYVIGTDDPEALAAFIEKELGEAPPPDEAPGTM
jgi:hypothetical protein